MSYAQAFKHSKRKKHNLCFNGQFSTGIPWPSPWANPRLAPRLHIERLWPRRSDPRVRCIIREHIADARAADTATR